MSAFKEYIMNVEELIYDAIYNGITGSTVEIYNYVKQYMEHVDIQTVREVCSMIDQDWIDAGDRLH